MRPDRCLVTAGVPNPSLHILSAAIFALTPVRARLRHPASAAAAAILVDADHVVDWAAYQLTHRRHLQIIPLHSWELAAVLLLARRPRARSIGAGLALHFVLDLSLGGYSVQRLSLLYRARHRFETDWLGDWALWSIGGWPSRSGGEPPRMRDADG